MSIDANIERSIGACRKQLGIIENAISNEIKKPIWQRRKPLLLFLYKEREVYSFALTQLEGLVAERICGARLYE
jgi:hypothetical protein